MMQVRTVAYTRPVAELHDDISAKTATDEFIAYCARVSNPANQGNVNTASKLLRYLVNNQHWSPFEMASMTMEIVTTRDIARQILRHRSFSFQEFSQRYAAVQADAVIREARLQDAKNRQASIEIDDDQLENEWRNKQTVANDAANRAYNWALANGIAKEVARCVLPEGMTESKLYMAGTVRSWIHYVMLRTSAGTQKEHREIAFACKAELIKYFPSVGDALNAAEA